MASFMIHNAHIAYGFRRVGTVNFVWKSNVVDLGDDDLHTGYPRESVVWNDDFASMFVNAHLARPGWAITPLHTCGDDV